MPNPALPTLTPRIRVGEVDYPAALSVAQFAALAGVRLDAVYNSLKKGAAPLAPIKMSGGRYAFSTVAACELLGLPYKFVTQSVVAA